MNHPECGAEPENETGIFSKGAAEEEPAISSSDVPGEGAAPAEAAGEDEGAPKKKRTIRPGVLYAAAAAILLAIAVDIVLIVRLNTGHGATLPGRGRMVDVVGMEVPEAERTLRKAGFTNVTTDVRGSDENRWRVTGQSAEPGKVMKTKDPVKLSCAKECRLYLDLAPEEAPGDAAGDITVLLDGEELGTVTGGEEFVAPADVLSGNHQLVLRRADGTELTKELTLNGDAIYSCTLTLAGGTLEIADETMENGAAGAPLKMVKVTGLILNEAKELLRNTGFTSIREEPFFEIWDQKGWLVVEQSIPAGTKADRGARIKLNCISLDEYFEGNYTGRSVAELQQMASASDITLIFETEFRKEIDISAMSEEEKAGWVAIAACQADGAERTALVTVEKRNVAGEEGASAAAGTGNALYYSTNDRDTAAAGSSGVYSYVLRGPEQDLYCIIDFDGGFVCTLRGGDGSCDRLKFEGENLNDGIVIRDGTGKNAQSRSLRFLQQGHPERLLVQESDGSRVEYRAVDLKEALALRDAGTVTDR